MSSNSFGAMRKLATVIMASQTDAMIERAEAVCARLRQEAAVPGKSVGRRRRLHRTEIRMRQVIARLRAEQAAASNRT